MTEKEIIRFIVKKQFSFSILECLYLKIEDEIKQYDTFIHEGFFGINS